MAQKLQNMCQLLVENRHNMSMWFHQYVSEWGILGSGWIPPICALFWFFKIFHLTVCFLRVSITVSLVVNLLFLSNDSFLFFAVWYCVLLDSTECYSEEGKTFELRLVGKIKQQLSADPTLRPEYPPSLGLTEFTRRASEVALGKSSRAIAENRVISAVHKLVTDRLIGPISGILR